MFYVRVWWSGERNFSLANVHLLRCQPLRTAAGLLASSAPNPIRLPGNLPILLVTFKLMTSFYHQIYQHLIESWGFRGASCKQIWITETDQ